MLPESDSYNDMADALKSATLPPTSSGGRNSMMADFNRRMGEAEELAIRGAFKKCLPLAQEILDDLRATTSSPDSHFLSTTSHQCEDDCICIAIVLLLFQLYHETRQSARIRPLLEQCYGSLELWPIEIFEAWLKYSIDSGMYDDAQRHLARYSADHKPPLAPGDHFRLMEMVTLFTFHPVNDFTGGFQYIHRSGLHEDQKQSLMESLQARQYEVEKELEERSLSSSRSNSPPTSMPMPTSSSSSSSSRRGAAKGAGALASSWVHVPSPSGHTSATSAVAAPQHVNGGDEAYGSSTSTSPTLSSSSSISTSSSIYSSSSSEFMSQQQQQQRPSVPYASSEAPRNASSLPYGRASSSSARENFASNAAPPEGNQRRMAEAARGGLSSPPRSAAVAAAVASSKSAKGKSKSATPEKRRNKWLLSLIHAVRSRRLLIAVIVIALLIFRYQRRRVSPIWESVKVDFANLLQQAFGYVLRGTSGPTGGGGSPASLAAAGTSPAGAY